jgi:hypothetical protein
MIAYVPAFDRLSELDDVLDTIFANDDPITKQGTFPNFVIIGEGGFSFAVLAAYLQYLCLLEN